MESFLDENKCSTSGTVCDNKGNAVVYRIMLQIKTFFNKSSSYLLTLHVSLHPFIRRIYHRTYQSFKRFLRVLLPQLIRPSVSLANQAEDIELPSPPPPPILCRVYFML